MSLKQSVCTVFLLSLLNPVASAEGEDTRLPVAEASLVKFVQEVLQTNPGLQATRSALVAGQARVSAAARPLYNPELEFDFENADSETRSIGISQTLDWSGKKKARSNVAGASLRALEAGTVSQRWAITMELVTALARYRIGQKLNELSQERIALMGQITLLAGKRLEAGDLSQVEYDVTNLAYVDSRLQRAVTAAALSTFTQQVRALVPNSAPSSWPLLQQELPHIERDRTHLNLLLVQLPEVMQTRYSVDMASALVNLRRKERRLDPTLSLRGGTEDDASLLGLNLSVPLPIRNSFGYEVDVAVAELEQAQYVADDTLRRARARLTATYENYTLAREAWQQWQHLGQQSLKSQADQLRALWETGELSTTDFLVQLKQTLDTRRSALELKLTLWEAWLGYLTASGQVDDWLGYSQTNR